MGFWAGQATRGPGRLYAKACTSPGLRTTDPDTLTSMGNLALTYSNQARWKEAAELDVQVMETSLKVLGDEHPHTLTSRKPGVRLALEDQK